MTKMLAAVTVMQRLQQRLQATGGIGGLVGAGSGGLPRPEFLDADTLAQMPTLDRPVAVAHGPAPSPTVVRQRPAPVGVDVEALRFTLLDTLSQLTGGTTGADSPTIAHTAAAALLHPAASPPPGDRVDEFVALATTIVHGDGDGDPAVTGVDRFLLAVAVLLRHRLDDDGWDDDGDLPAAVGQLLSAAETVPADHPAAATVIGSLPAFLEGRQPLGGVLDGTAERFAARAAAILATPAPSGPTPVSPSGSGSVSPPASVPPSGPGPASSGSGSHGAAGVWAADGLAVVEAVRCLCQAAAAGREGQRQAAEDLGRAVGAVPAGYPWLSWLKAAVLAADADPATRRGVGAMLVLGRAEDAFRTLERAATPGDPPAVADVAAAVAAVGADAMVWQHPVDGPGGDAGVLLLEPRTGDLTTLGVLATAAVPGAVLNHLDAAGRPCRVLVCAAAHGDQAAWSAAPAPGLTVSFVASGRQVLDLAARTVPPVAAGAVFVANPLGDRDAATVEVMALRRILYPRSTGLGRTVEQVDGAGTPADVLAHLPGPAGPGAAVLDLGCTLRAEGVPALELAGPAALDVDAVAAHAVDRTGDGGLVVLPADSAVHHGRWVSFADGLIAAGMTGVVGWLRPVPQPVAAVMRFLLHTGIADEGLEPAAAVHAVRAWMRDPGRIVPAHLPAGYAAAVRDVDLADVHLWSALCHRGR